VLGDLSGRYAPPEWAKVALTAGNVDRSIWVGTEAQLRAWHATGILPAE
jgi:hypothetical protein